MRTQWIPGTPSPPPKTQESLGTRLVQLASGLHRLVGQGVGIVQLISQLYILQIWDTLPLSYYSVLQILDVKDWISPCKNNAWGVTRHCLHEDGN